MSIHSTHVVFLVVTAAHSSGPAQVELDRGNIWRQAITHTDRTQAHTDRTRFGNATRISDFQCRLALIFFHFF